MRANIQLLAKHVPLIKFVGGPHPHPANITSTVKAHPCAPENMIPGSVPTTYKPSSNSTSSSDTPGTLLSRSQLPKRFRYSAVDELEIEGINTGGAEVIF